MKGERRWRCMAKLAGAGASVGGRGFRKGGGGSWGASRWPVHVCRGRRGWRWGLRWGSWGGKGRGGEAVVMMGLRGRREE